MNDTERYLFDLNGFLIVEDLLSSHEVDELNGLIDEYELWRAKGSEERFREVWQYGDNYLICGPSHTWDRPFRRTISHPRLLPYLQAIVGETVRYDHGHVILMEHGAGRLGLHGGGTPWDPAMYYHWHAGEMYNGLLVVSLALCDMTAADGGFVCIPGSHKANMPCPPSFLTFDETAPTLFRASVRAGSAVIFSEALTHGTWPWSGSHERRALLMKYCPGHMAYQSTYPVPEDVPEEPWTEALRPLFEPPYIVASNDQPRVAAVPSVEASS